MVDVVSWGGGQPQLDGIKVIEDGLVALIDGAVAFICHDQVVVAHRQARIYLRHARVGGELNACTGSFAGFDTGQALVG
ncbi:hypothetical protein D3C78_1662100 [compost metagenome]